MFGQKLVNNISEDKLARISSKQEEIYFNRKKQLKYLYRVLKGDIKYDKGFAYLSYFLNYTSQKDMLNLLLNSKDTEEFSELAYDIDLDIKKCYEDGFVSEPEWRCINEEFKLLCKCICESFLMFRAIRYWVKITKKKQDNYTN